MKTYLLIVILSRFSISGAVPACPFPAETLIICSLRSIIALLHFIT